MRQYLDLLHHILNHGKRRPNRTGTDTIGVFGHQMRFDLREGFPLLTTKKLHFRGIAEELFWFLSGDTNAKTLQAKGVRIWDEWATAEKTAKFGRPEGDLGPVYGWAWRHFGGDYDLRLQGADLTPGNPETLSEFEAESRKGVDQIANLVRDIIKSPSSRRLILTGWDPRTVDQVELPPCHCLAQFYVQDGELSCHLYQRSADCLLGVPYNIASYALLTHLLAFVCGLRVRDFVHSFGDAHLYVNHLEQVELQLTRHPRHLPQLRIRVLPPLSVPTNTPDAALAKLLSLRFEDLVLSDYDPAPAIAAPVAV